MDKSTSISFRPATKAFHHKSRKGCRTCKARRVKCDERRPVCSKCERYDRGPCIYDSPIICWKPTLQQTDLKSTRNPSSERDPVGTKSDPGSDADLVSSVNSINFRTMSESRSRRLMELRLLHHMLVRMGGDIPKALATSWWSAELPRLALQHDNVQYMLYTYSAMHLLQHVPHADPEVAVAQRLYMAQAIYEQRKTVANFTIKNSDAACFAALLLLLVALADLGGRPLEPYTPPLEWLHLGNGAGSVFTAAKDLVANRQQASTLEMGPQPPMKLKKIINNPTVLARNRVFAKENLRRFSTVLDFHSEELGDAGTREVYENTLCLLGGIHDAIDAGEPFYLVGRKVVAFAIFAPREFTQFVNEPRPRALVILAHYFALMTHAEPLWWVGNTPQREIEAIQKVLPAEWQHLIRWPLEVVERTPA